MSRRNPYDVLILFDVPTRSLVHENLEHLIKTNADYQDERDIFLALLRLGHKVRLFAIYDEVEFTIQYLKATRPDVVFCSFETIAERRDLAPKLVAAMELLGIKHTGASASTLELCKDKGMTKKILHYHEIDVPRFFIPNDAALKQTDYNLGFPLIVKPRDLEASEGIGTKSVVTNHSSLCERISYIKEKFGSASIVEEYIDGREIYVGIIAGQKPKVLSPQEMWFGSLPKQVPHIASYRAKWDPDFRKKYGIDSGKPRNLSKQLASGIDRTGKQIANALELTGYVRLDLRVREDGRIFFIEANPNPAIKAHDDFPNSASDAGISYDQLIQMIVLQGLSAA